MKHGRIRLETTGDVAVMTLNDPSVLNAFGQKLREDMADAMDRVEAGPARCLVITGAGRAFCSGANLNDPDRPPRDRAAEARGEAKSDLEAWYNPHVHAPACLAHPDRHRDQRDGRRRGHEPRTVRRYPDRRAVGFVPAGLRPHRAGAGLRVLLVAAAADRHGPGDGAVVAGRTPAGGNRVGLGPDQPPGGRRGPDAESHGNGARPCGRSQDRSA